ncbi:hypothetical protein [Clostridium muellerianum]|nr:hypothetical protein [Clostridium muellerianum]
MNKHFIKCDIIGNTLWIYNTELISMVDEEVLEPMKKQEISIE